MGEFIKKYRILSDDTIIREGKKLYRIVALKDFSDVKQGDKGGYIQSESNLSQEGNCWLYKESCVCGKSKIKDNVRISDNVFITDSVEITDDVKVLDNVRLSGKIKLSGNFIIVDNVQIWGDVIIHSSPKSVLDVMRISGNAKICGNAVIEKNSDYIVFKNWWSTGNYFTWTRSNNNFYTEFYYGDSAGLIEMAYRRGEIEGKEYERIVRYIEEIM